MARNKKRRLRPGFVEDLVLAIVRAHGPVPSTFVAMRLWPDSDGWNRAGGRGIQGLARAGARILHRLRRQGLIIDEFSKGAVKWRLSIK